jgi:hypothetical protein
MATVHIDNVGEIAVMECAGTFVGKKAALKLRDSVKAQTNALIVILDLTEMRAIGK